MPTGTRFIVDLGSFVPKSKPKPAKRAKKAARPTRPAARVQRRRVREHSVAPYADVLTVAELFAGVGGFRLGLESAKGGSWRVVWSNQWEPGRKNQFASDCYVQHFGAHGHVCDDIARALDRHEAGEETITDVDMLVGGFPCQDYSVAKPLNQSAGLVGKKGVLWWEIHRFLEIKKRARRPVKYLLLENVDRLLKSPSGQRGRDFAIILACLSALGYDVEWRVVNAADYGFPQRRRRVFIVATLRGKGAIDGTDRILKSGILANALPCVRIEEPLLEAPALKLGGDIPGLSRNFGRGLTVSPFRNAGFMRNGTVWTFDVASTFTGKRMVLRDVLEREEDVDGSFYVAQGQIAQWRYLKGSKNEPRVHKTSGTTYYYTEGALPFPDPIDRPARTILTAEGGSSPSRFRHIIQTSDGRFRRLTPLELERLNGFTDRWTDTGMSDGQRAFCMGNALVVGVVELIGGAIASVAKGTRSAKASNGKSAKAKGAAA